MLNPAMYLKYGISSLILLLGVLIPEIAMAGPFDPGEGDKSKEIIIDSLFGPISGGGDNSPFSSVIEVFNTAVLFVGGILLAYTLIAGTMQTAHDGEMLGKKWSSLWLPVRTALGVAAIIPVKAGFCFAQIAVVWLALQGVGIANQVWSGFVTQQHDVADTYLPPSAIMPIRSLLNEMLKGSTCVAAGNEQARLTTREGNVFGVATEVEALEDATGIKYGPHNVCGLVSIKSQPTASDISGNLGQFFNTAQFEAQLYPIHREQLLAAHAELTPLGKKIADAEEATDTLKYEVNTALDRIAQRWAGELQKTAKVAYKSSVDKNLMQNIKDDGWMMAGMWYIKFATAQDAVSRGISAVPNIGGSSNAVGRYAMGWIDGPAANKAVERAEIIVSTNRALGQSAIESYGTDNATNVSGILSWFMNDDFSAISSMSEDSANLNQNPVLMASNLGSNMSVWGWGAWVTGVVAGTAASTTVLGTGFASFATMISPMLTALAGTIIVAGATLSTYIPMLPYILWIGVVFGWAVLLVEAVVAAPLWAVSHLAPDGDGVVGRGGQGYMLILSLTLRPALMVIGFVAAVILMKPLGYLINSTFFGAFLANANPSWWSLAQIITGCVIYTVLMVSVITRIFALIHVIPDRLLRWIGGSQSNELGQEAHGIESHTGAKAVAGVHAAQTIGQAGQQGIQQAKNLAAHNKGNLSNKASASAQQTGNAADAAHRAQGEFNNAREDYQADPTPENEARLADATESMQQSQYSHARSAAMSAQAHAAANPKDEKAQTRAKEATAFLARAKAHEAEHGRSGAALAKFAQSEQTRPGTATSAAQAKLASAQQGLAAAESNIAAFKAENPDASVPAGLSKQLTQAQGNVAKAEAGLSQAQKADSSERSSTWAQAMRHVATGTAQSTATVNASLSSLRAQKPEIGGGNTPSGGGSGGGGSGGGVPTAPQADLFDGSPQGDMFDGPGGAAGPVQGDLFGNTPAGQAGRGSDARTGSDGSGNPFRTPRSGRDLPGGDE